MFTGIVLAIGKISAKELRSGDSRITIETGQLSLENASLGDSIAVNGVCLTAVELGQDYFCADVSRETLSRTTLQALAAGSFVNLELALTPTTRMGGHMVSGHVDGLGMILDKKADARSFQFKFKAPDSLAKYIAEKGSICIDGVSLTVNTVDGAVFSVNVVPHTLQETTLGKVGVGQKVNLEVDMLVRYMERLMQGDNAAKSTNQVTQELLQQSGFIE